MAWKVTHNESGRQLRFPNRDAAEAYVEHYGGGSERWTLTEIANRDPAQQQLSRLLPEHQPIRRTQRRTHG